MKNRAGISLFVFTLLLLPSGTSSARQSWDSQNSTVTSDLYGIKAVTSTLAWACGAGGVVLRTLDGGTTWKVVAKFTFGGWSMNCYSVDAVTSNTAWVVIVADSAGMTRSWLGMTTDAGTNWSYPLGSATQGTFYNAVRFYDASNGILMGDPENGYFAIYATTNGGTTWSRTLQSNIPSPLSGEFGLVNNMAIFGNNAWFGSQGGSNVTRVFRSTDRGKSWSATSVLGGLGTSLMSTSFANDQLGIIVGNNGSVSRTTNGGISWSSPLAVTAFGAGITFVGSSAVIMVGQGAASSAFLSTDAGVTWTGRPAGVNTRLSAVSFANTSVGWAVGVGGTILKWVGGSLSAPTIALSQTSLLFGTVAVGTSSQQTFTVSNTGTATLTVSSVTSDNVRFTVSPSSFSVSPGGTPQAVTVTFTPAAAVTYNGTISLTHNASGSPSTVSVSGTGGTAAAISLSTTSLSFGTVSVGSSGQQTFTVSNPGSATLSVSSVTSDNVRFTVSLSSFSVAPGGTPQTVTVTFTPAAAISYTGTVSLTHNAAGSPSTVSVSGTGTSVALKETEPNNTASQANTISYGDSLDASINPAGDVDYYRFTASAGDTVEVLAYATATSKLEPAIQLYDASGNELAYSDFFVTDNDARIVHRIPSAGSYYIRFTARYTGGGFPNSASPQNRLKKEGIGDEAFVAKKAMDPTGDYRVRLKRFTTSAPTLAFSYIFNTYSTSTYLAAVLYTNGLPTTVTIQYGTTTSYGQSVSTSAAADLQDSYTEVLLSSLSPNTTYNYRVVATNSRGSSSSSNETFTTPASPQGWTSQKSGTSDFLIGVSFADANTGTVVGDNGTILRTTNGGTTWTSQTSGTTAVLYAVSLASATIGTAVGTNGTILRTTNGGSTWISQSSGTSYTLRAVHFADANTGTAVGSGGVILRTTNGGSTWTSQSSGTSSGLRGVFFVDALSGTVTGVSGTILRTSNGGSSWITQTSGTTENLYGVSFTSASTGTVVGFNGVILRTTNSGATWTRQTSGTTNWLWAVQFTDSNTGTVVGENGTILRTTNGGATWVAQSSGTYNWMYAVSSAGDATTAVGDYGMILRFTGTAAAAISLSTTSISFGTVNVGSSSQQTFTVSNPGTATLTVSSVTSDNVRFAVSPSSFSISAGGSAQTVTVTFSPTSGGSQSSTITLIHNASGGSSSVTATGTGETKTSGLATSTGRFSSGIPASSWVLMSVPFTLDNQAASALASQLSGQNAWKMYAYVSGSNQETTNTGDAFQLTRGFWFKTVAKSSAFTLSFGSGTLTGGSTYQITAPTGWSLIGPPFYNNEATWSPVNTTAGSSGIRVWKYAHESSSWVGPLSPSVEPMKPFGGYAVYNQTGAAATFTFMRGNPSSKIVSEWQEGDGWYMIVQVGSAALRIGQHRGAEGGLAAYNYPMPPSRPEREGEDPYLEGKLWSDIRPVSESTPSSWRVSVDPKEANSIEMKEVNDLPSGWKVVAVGIPNSDLIDLTKRQSYLLPPDVKLPFTMQILAGPATSLDKEIVPDGFVLHQNYPNPFNPTTNIGYELARETILTLTIYNLLGNEVVTLVHGNQKAGTYEVRWNGTDSKGLLVTSGLYICRIQSRDFVASRKMLFLR